MEPRAYSDNRFCPSGFLILLAKGLSEHGPWMEDVMGKHLTTGQIRELVDIDRSRGGIGEEVQSLIARLTHDCAADITWIGEVAVDYGSRPSYEDLNKTWFDWANKRFGAASPELRQLDAKPLPMSGVVRHRYGYVHLGWEATDQEALAEIAKRGVVPATDLELMYFGNAFPEEQRKFPIVALRSFFRDDHYLGSAVLCGHDRQRGLDLSFRAVGYPWIGRFRFLVREDSE